MARGLFIAFEGVEGAGKTTQVALFAERCRVAGLTVVVVREPGGTRFAEECRNLLLHAPHDLTPASELFLFNAARADLVAKVIGPALARGEVVVADRYELSSRAYQVAGRGLRESAVRSVIALATGGVRPDAYVVLDLDPRTGRARQRKAGKGRDRIEREDSGFHSRVYRAFRDARGPGIIHVRASGRAASVAEAVWSRLVRRFPAHLHG